ncbi:MAG: hypothetical protein WC744_04500 [Patescibacteria group bacterium]
MKNFILVLTCLLIILGVYLSLKKFQVLMQQNDELRRTANQIPSSASGDVIKY